MILVGDVHGNFDTLIALLDMIPKEEKDRGVVICGDLIDRGPKSKEVVQWCIDNNIKVVRGNHEEMMIDESALICNFIKKTGFPPRGNAGSLWTVNGGYETLKSYEVVDEDNLDERGLPTVTFDFKTFNNHVNYMLGLPTYIEFPDIKNNEGRYLVASHSNINNVWNIRESIKNNERERFLSEVLWGRPTKIKDIPYIYNVTGHTPREFGPRIRSTYACIDTGCFYTTGGFGRLTALQFPEMIIYEHENIDSKVGHTPLKNILTVEENKQRKKKNRIK